MLIFKKGDTSFISSYRPISIIPTMGKTLEVILKVQLTSYFEGSNLFNDKQYMSREGKSTVSLLSFEENDSIRLTLIDLSRAFDCLAQHFASEDGAL